MPSCPLWLEGPLVPIVTVSGSLALGQAGAFVLGETGEDTGFAPVPRAFFQGLLGLHSRLFLGGHGPHWDV